MPFKANAACRHHIPKQTCKVTNWPAYNASLRQRGSLTAWFSEEAIASGRAAPRTSHGRQAWYSPLAILTAMTLRAVFRLALHQTEGLIGSIIDLLGLGLSVPTFSTLSRRAETVEVPRSRARNGADNDADSEPLHLQVDSTGLKLCGAGEWLIEKHGTTKRRSWRKLHIGVAANTGQSVAATLTTNDVDDASEVGPLLEQLDGPRTSFTADGKYDQASVYDAVTRHDPEAAVIVPPRSTATLSETTETEATQRDRLLQDIAEKGRLEWQKASGYNVRSRVEAAVGRYRQVIGDGLRSRKDKRRAIEVAVAVQALNRMLELGCPIPSASNELR